MACLCLLCAPLAAAVDERLAGLLAVRFQCGTNDFDLVSGFADAIEGFHYRGDALKLPVHIALCAHVACSKNVLNGRLYVN